MGRSGQRKGGKKKRGSSGGKKNELPALRFKYGDRVDYRPSENESWETGTIIRVNSDAKVKDSSIAPYQILMDSGACVLMSSLTSSYDIKESIIRKLDSPSMPVEYQKRQPVDVKLSKDGEWRRGHVLKANKDWTEQEEPPYIIQLDNDNDGNLRATRFYGPAQFIRKAELRFKVGARVQCDGLLGTVVKHWSAVNPNDEDGDAVPYEVLQDNLKCRLVLLDTDKFISSSNDPPISVRFERGDRVEVKDIDSDGNNVWNAGTVFHSNPDWIGRDIPPYFIKFDDGRYESFCGPNNHIRASDAAVPSMDNDASLFVPPPPMPECPICFLPFFDGGNDFDLLYIQHCCGKKICCGCNLAMVREMGERHTCPFCRAPPLVGEEVLARIRKRVECNDAESMYELGCCFYAGTLVPKDELQAFQLYKRAADLGHPAACCIIAGFFEEGLEDEKKAIFYYEKAAKLGSVTARYNLGTLEWKRRNIDLAFRHWKISASAGCQASLNDIAQGYRKGLLSKQDYEEVLRAGLKSKVEAWSQDRSMATKELTLTKERWLQKNQS
jgi:hypothetical protein